MTVLKIFFIISILILVLGVLSERLKNSLITAPMICVLFGISLGPWGFGLIPPDLDAGFPATHGVLELTLIIILFSDACKAPLLETFKRKRVTARLLTVGMGLTLIMGMFFAVLLFPSLGFFRAALLGALLTPTDIALGQGVIHSPKIPHQEKRTLTLESGLNDGLILPVILFLSICDSIWTGVQYTGFWIWYFIKQFGGGIGVGVLVGYLGYYILCFGCEKKRMSDIFEQLSGLAFALLAYSAAQMIGGNGFIAAFIAGLTLARKGLPTSSKFVEFVEAQAQLFSLIAFLIFGALIIGPQLNAINGVIILYAMLSLTIVRMVPVAIALYGYKIEWPTVLLLGWFGPRGIVSVLFGLLVLETFTIEAREQIFLIVSTTVLLSVFLHGASAIPLSNYYSTKITHNS